MAEDGIVDGLILLNKCIVEGGIHYSAAADIPAAFLQRVLVCMLRNLEMNDLYNRKD